MVKNIPLLYNNTPSQRTVKTSCWLMVMAVSYNALLAFINANIMHISNAHVMIVEILVVLSATFLVIQNLKYVSALLPTLIFIGISLFLFLWVSFLNETIALKSIRDYYNIAIFLLLGTLCNKRAIILTFRVLSIVVFTIMIIEGYFTALYVSIFEPAQYYASTRGMEGKYNDVGVFGASLSFEGRFSYGIFDTHRLSSIFLEQVSLANFSTVLAIFTSALWSHLKKYDKIFFIILTLFIILSNDTRVGSVLALIIFSGFFIFPMLPKYTNILYMPLIILMVTLLFYDPYIHTLEDDDLKGRLSYSLYIISDMSFYDIMGDSLAKTGLAWDSGYAYIIFSQSIFGLLLLWLYTSLIVPQNTASRKRLTHGVNLSIFLNLLVSGAIFSIKFVAPLWFIIGFLCTNRLYSSK